MKAIIFLVGEVFRVRRLLPDHIPDAPEAEQEEAGTGQDVDLAGLGEDLVGLGTQARRPARHPGALARFAAARHGSADVHCIHHHLFTIAGAHTPTAICHLPMRAEHTRTRVRARTSARGVVYDLRRTYSRGIFMMSPGGGVISRPKPNKEIDVRFSSCSTPTGISLSPFHLGYSVPVDRLPTRKPR